jgi:hypothetical protein
LKNASAECGLKRYYLQILLILEQTMYAFNFVLGMSGLAFCTIIGSLLLRNPNITPQRFAVITVSLFLGVFLALLFYALGITFSSIILGGILSAIHLAVGYPVLFSFHRRYWSSKKDM